MDMIDTLPGEEINLRLYSSIDSEIGDTRHKTPSDLVVYWRPKVPIKPFQSYTHCSSHVSPSKYGTDAFYHSIYFDRDVGISELVIETSVPIGEAVAYVLPVYQSQITAKRLYQHWLSKSRRGCEQPTMLSPKHILWKLERPQKGRVYVLFAIYEGERDRYVSESRDLFFRYSIKAYMKQLVGRARVYLAQ
ncbi:MAG TPA: hypothetical protein VHW02_11525 [Rhizomicrobium sp.]|nr:hypothetical protein [Rhizomicrobium sp.]